MAEVINSVIVCTGFACSIYLVVLTVCIAEAHADIDEPGLIVSPKAIKSGLMDSFLVFGAIVMACVICAIFIAPIFIALSFTRAQ